MSRQLVTPLLWSPISLSLHALWHQILLLCFKYERPVSRSSSLCDQATTYQAPIIPCTGFLFCSPMSVWPQLWTSVLGKVSKHLQESQVHSLVRSHTLTLIMAKLTSSPNELPPWAHKRLISPHSQGQTELLIITGSKRCSELCIPFFVTRIGCCLPKPGGESVDLV